MEPFLCELNCNRSVPPGLNGNRTVGCLEGWGGHRRLGECCLLRHLMDPAQDPRPLVHAPVFQQASKLPCVIRQL